MQLPYVAALRETPRIRMFPLPAKTWPDRPRHRDHGSDHLHLSQRVPEAWLAGGQAMAQGQPALPAIETDGLAQQQPGHHPAQLRQVALGTGGAVLTHEAGQLNMQLGKECQRNLDWCLSPTLPWRPAHPMI